jgi:hypothetical protein
MRAASSSKLCFLLLLCLQSACSLRYVGQDGVDRYIGFLIVKSSHTPCTVDTTIESAGVTVDFTKQSGGINIGYRSVTTAEIKPDSVVEIQDNGATAPVVVHYGSEVPRTVGTSTSRLCQ